MKSIIVLSIFILSWNLALFSQNNFFLNFDGIDDFVQVENNNEQTFIEDFTIEVRIRRERENIREDIFNKKDVNLKNNPTTNDVGIFIDSNNKLVFYLSDSMGKEIFLYSNSKIDTKKWYHIACLRKEKVVKIIINGNIEAQSNFGTSLISNGPLRIGSNRKNLNDYNGPPEFNFKGDIDELRIWKISRNIEQIIEFQSKEILNTETGLISYYNFNQGNPCMNNKSEIILIDETNFENIGLLKNFSLKESLSSFCKSNWAKDTIINILPNKIQNTIVNYKDEITLERDEIELKIWDDNQEDGDIITIFLNNEIILENFEVLKKPQKVKIKLKKGKNSLVMFANNLGRVGKNTAALELKFDGFRKKIILNSDEGKSEGIILIR